MDGTGADWKGASKSRAEPSRAEPNESSIESDVESSQNASNIKLWAGRRAREKSISCGEREDHGEGGQRGQALESRAWSMEAR